MMLVDDDTVQNLQKKDSSADRLATSLLNTFNSPFSAHTGLSQHCVYRNVKLYLDTCVMPFYAPHLQHYWQEFPLNEPDIKGRIDALSLRLIYSDTVLHQSLKPETQIAGLVFEMLEQARVESLLPPQWPGMALNIDQLFRHWSRTFHDSGLTDTTVGILLYTLAQMCRARLMAQAVSAETESLIEHTRAALSGAIGTPLSGLRRCQQDQQKYADYALEIAHIIETMIETEQRILAANEGATNTEKVLKGFAILLDVVSHEGEGIATGIIDNNKGRSKVKSVYHVFTTQFDKVVFPAKLVRAELLREYRTHLDKLVLQQTININRLARQIVLKLSQLELDGWQSAKDEGYIDGGRLPLIVCSPSETALFYQAHLKPIIHSQVSFLVDCSGSMKTHANKVATLLDILVRALDVAKVETEVLGFTTGAWNGGPALKQWRRQACPPHPGRLNSVSHLVFKQAKQSWRSGRLGLASMLKLDLYKEGIDGEAVEWASQRLLNQETQRKILIVISDGSPMDTATHQTNDPLYLDNHLKDVVFAQQRLGVEIIGVGVGIDLSSYYPRNLAIDLGQELDVSLFNTLVDLITSTKR
ncbi:cobalt chelatase [Shewanella sp. GutDb-MelDb]|jgi:cobaltochelatase CobT|uniref:cobaltochelatase CobT-related protein n=1 Tax=Shewanella sp. GutDb-MelDb TaxID=2058316 RepID=UPI000C7DB0C5|nr:cobalt chelatase [Shewanella sp. GutDb-MelDb]PKG55209.1 cobalt chelatase [Shewanella sp. GutDb-MelDb]